MATIQDIVTGGFRKLGVVRPEETPNAADSAYALSELNDMMLEMPGQRIFLAWTTVVLTDTFELDDHHIGGVKAMLAVRISPTYGGDGLLSSRLVKESAEGYNRLFGDYHRPDQLAVDDALANMPSFWYYGIDNVNV